MIALKSRAHCCQYTLIFTPPTAVCLCNIMSSDDDSDDNDIYFVEPFGASFLRLAITSGNTMVRGIEFLGPECCETFMAPLPPELADVEILDVDPRAIDIYTDAVDKSIWMPPVLRISCRFGHWTDLGRINVHVSVQMVILIRLTSWPSWSGAYQHVRHLQLTCNLREDTLDLSAFGDLDTLVIDRWLELQATVLPPRMRRVWLTRVPMLQSPVFPETVTHLTIEDKTLEPVRLACLPNLAELRLRGLAVDQLGEVSDRFELLVLHECTVNTLLPPSFWQHAKRIDISSSSLLSLDTPVMPARLVSFESSGNVAPDLPWWAAFFRGTAAVRITGPTGRTIHVRRELLLEYHPGLRLLLILDEAARSGVVISRRIAAKLMQQLREKAFQSIVY